MAIDTQASVSRPSKPLLVQHHIALYQSGLIYEYMGDKPTRKGTPGPFHKNQNDDYSVQMLHVTANGTIDTASLPVAGKPHIGSITTTHCSS